MNKKFILIKNGKIIDGTGDPSYSADILISKDKIIDIGKFNKINNVDIVEADGLLVTPGFIDIHSHSDFTLLIDPRAVSSISQGVTTEIIGNCGYGCNPIKNPLLAKEAIYGFRNDFTIDWSDMNGYLQRLEEKKPSVNVIPLVPNGQLRLSTVGLDIRPATKDELSTMKKLLIEGLEQGGHGFSTGLEYSTEIGASEEEITDLCKICSKFDGIYSTHTRNRDEKSLIAIEEAIRTAYNSNVKLQISHLTPRGGENDLYKALNIVDDALKNGLDIAFDMHTRFFGTTYLKVILPTWALEGGKNELIKRLKNKNERLKIKSHRNVLSNLGDWDRIVLLDNHELTDLSRKSIGTIAKERLADPLDCALDIILEHIQQLDTLMVILHTYSENLLSSTYKHPKCSVGSDATALAPDGILGASTFHGAYTWASWFYRRMVRELKLFSPEEAVWKLSGLAAKRLNLSNLGVIKKGAQADLAIFNSNDFGEEGTTFHPNKIAKGMIHVLVNGRFAMRNGTLNSERAGKVIRKI